MTEQPEQPDQEQTTEPAAAEPVEAPAEPKRRRKPKAEPEQEATDEVAAQRENVRRAAFVRRRRGR